jgi:carbamoyl-phosphate synthase large subunit
VRPVTVLVTGVGGGGLGEQILKALRLADTAYKVIGTDVGSNSKGLMEVDEAEIVPPALDPAYTRALLAICERHQVSAVLCGSEAELTVLDRDRTQFAARNIFLPINSSSVLATCMDKAKTFEFLAASGFRVARWKRICSVSDVAGFPLPAVVKPSTGGGGSANLYLAQTASELEFFAAYLLQIYPEFLAQEYVGTPDDEYTVGVLSDMEGKVLNSIVLRRQIMSALSNRLKVPNRTGRLDLGRTLAISNGITQGEFGKFPIVTRACESIAAVLGSQGALNIQCRVAGDDVFVFEINPRFSGTTSMRAMVGYNEPDLLIRRYVLGQPIVPHFPYRSALILRGLAEVIVDPSRVGARSDEPPESSSTSTLPRDRRD